MDYKKNKTTTPERERENMIEPIALCPPNLRDDAIR